MKSHLIHFLFFAVTLVIAIEVARAGSNNLNFHRVTVEDGLSQGSITAILQDRKVFIRSMNY